MGRNRIHGYDFCPVPTCNELSLGHIRTKQTRSRKNAMYLRHYYFVHNRNGMKEHYVPIKLARQKELDKIERNWPASYDIIKSLSVLGEAALYGFREAMRIAEKSKSWPLTEEEDRRAANALDWHGKSLNHIERILLYIDSLTKAAILGIRLPEMSQDVENSLEELAKVAPLYGIKPMSMPFSLLNPLKMNLSYLFKKYEIPESQRKNNERAEKLRHSYNYPRDTLH